jgi:hypothetical protein
LPPNSYNQLCKDHHEQVAAHSWLAAEAMEILAGAASKLRESKGQKRDFFAISSQELFERFKKDRVKKSWDTERRYNRMFFRRKGAKGYVPHQTKITLGDSSLDDKQAGATTAGHPIGGGVESSATSSADEPRELFCRLTPTRPTCNVDKATLPAPRLLPTH